MTTQTPLPRPHLPSSLLCAALVAIVSCLFFTKLACPLLEPEETRYAEIPREMLGQGRFIEPVWHGAPYYHKPPLFYWLVMGSYCLFGVHDWAARLVPALAALGTVLLTFAWGRRAAGPWAGFLGALVLCLTPRFVYLGRMVTLDGLLCLAVTAALACAHRAVSGAWLCRGWWMLSALACGLGLLTKGPVALALIAVPLVVYPLLDRSVRRPGFVAWLAYLSVVGAVAGPWYLAVTACDPAAAAAFFWQHNVLRYVAPLDHARPFWFYLPGLLLGTLPWSLLLLPLARLLWRRRPDEEGLRAPPLGFCLLASSWCLLFFSASGCKRAAYVVPCLPPLALALGCYLARAVRWDFAGAKGVRPGWGHAALFTALVLGVAAGLTAIQTGIWPAATGASTAAGLTVALVAVVLLRRRVPAPRAWALCGVAMFALSLVAVLHLLPGYHRKFALRGQVRRHRALADTRLPVLCYPHRWDSVCFYLQRDDVAAHSPAGRRDLVADLEKRAETLVFVKSDRSKEELLKALPPALEFVPRGRAGAVVTAGVVRRRSPRKVEP